MSKGNAAPATTLVVMLKRRELLHLVHSPRRQTTVVASAWKSGAVQINAPPQRENALVPQFIASHQCDRTRDRATSGDATAAVWNRGLMRAEDDGNRPSLAMASYTGAPGKGNDRTTSCDRVLTAFEFASSPTRLLGRTGLAAAAK